MQKLTALILSMGFCLVLCAQEPADSIRVLPESTVVGDRMDQGKGLKEMVVTYTTIRGDYQKEYPSADLSKLLSSTSGFAFQNYGVSGSSLAHYRGSSPEQFQVLWSGVNINSPFLGQFDFSLVPSAFFIEPSFNDNANGLLESPGAVGGSLSLHDGTLDHLIQHNGKRRLGYASIEYNSLNNLFVLGNFGVKTKQRSFYTKISFSELNNAFSFNNTALAGNPKTEMQNADGRVLNFAQHFTQRIKGNTQLKFKYWTTLAERGIPIQDFQTSRNDRQADGSHRFSLVLVNQSNVFPVEYKWKVGAASIFDRIDYNGDESLARKTSLFAEITNKKVRSPRVFEIRSRINADFVEAETNNYETVQKRNVFGFSTKALYRLRNFKNNVWTFSGSIRQDLLEEELMPTVGSLSISFDDHNADILQNWELELSRNYRYPSLNDWYWSPGGNPDLMPEHSMGAELSQKCEFRLPFPGRVKFELSQYYTFTTDWIQWQPTPEGFWSPMNVNEVVRMGIDWKLRYLNWRNSLKGLTIDLSGNLNRTQQKNGDALLYHPAIKNNLGISFYPLRYYKVSANYEMQHRRWDGNEFMDDLHVVDLNITRTRFFKSINFQLQASVKNLFDYAYVYRPHQIMPGRHFSIKLSYNLPN